MVKALLPAMLLPAMLLVAQQSVAESEYIIDVSEVRQNVQEDSFYADIMNRQDSPFSSSDRGTNAHETTHGINSELRNKYYRQSNDMMNAFYVGGGKAVLLKEPSIRKLAVIEFLPVELRSYRYGLYIAGQREWDDRPLYLVDEWVCYVNGGAVSVQDALRGRGSKERTDAVSGCLDFSIYCVALCMAIEKGDPVYWKTNKRFRHFMNWHLAKAEVVFNKGRAMDRFQVGEQEKLLESLRSSAAGSTMRTFLDKHFNGTWLGENR